MPEYAQIIVGLILLLAVFAITRIVIANRIRHAATLIMQDLKSREAFDPSSAAELLYARPQYFRIGLRDYRPKALESLIQGGIVEKTENGKYYLREVPGFQNNAL